MKILVTTSTLKQDVNDSSPEFINNLIEGMSKLNDNNEFIYLYPYKGRDPVKENIIISLTKLTDIGSQRLGIIFLTWEFINQ